MKDKTTRRQVLKLISSSGIALYLAPLITSTSSVLAESNISKISPIDRNLGEIAPRNWFSDYPDKAHKILWDKSAFMNSLGAEATVSKEQVPLVVIGAGIAGLFSAYLLRAHKPVILEQAPRFGGNSKGQSWHTIDYSIGAAYFIEPEEKSEISKILHELGVDKLWKIKNEEDPVAIQGKIFKEFWDGASVKDAGTKKQFVKLSEYFKKVNEGEEITYPDIPITDPEIKPYIDTLDKETFKSHLERIVGGPLNTQIETAIEHYCWSSLGASASEVSAAAGLNFYAAEFGNLAILPGGNAAVAERVLERLSARLPAENFRTDCLVYDVRVVNDGVLVSYQDKADNVQSIRAKAVVLACPKFVVGRILAEIESSRLAAIRRLRYHSYLVANICIQGHEKAPFYDLYLLGEGKLASNDLKTAADNRKVTDVIYANYVKASDGDTVLTLYRGLPYDGARVEILAPDSYQRYRNEFQKQLEQEILPLLRIKKEQVKDIRIARWGHPLPVATPGLIAEGVVDILRKPFKDRVFFVEQDNWALPAFETAVTEALIAAPEVQRILGAKPI